MINNIEYFSEKKNIENFSMQPTKDICHYTCSRLSLTNILMLVIIIILLYFVFNN